MKLSKIIIITLGFGLFILAAFSLFEPSASPTGFFVYTPGIAIINPINHAGLNSNLEIEFITKGTNDLKILPSGAAEIVELRCDDKVAGYGLEYKDYSCDGSSYLVVRVLSERVELDIKFGDKTQQAINIVS
jgi:hypothetical protein